MSAKTGPTIRIEMSCLNCQYCESKRYQVQGDSGCDVRCTHPAALKERYIGDSKFKTPGWCPVLPEAWGDILTSVLPQAGEE